MDNQDHTSTDHLQNELAVISQQSLVMLEGIFQDNFSKFTSLLADFKSVSQDYASVKTRIDDRQRVLAVQFEKLRNSVLGMSGGAQEALQLLTSRLNEVEAQNDVADGDAEQETVEKLESRVVQCQADEDSVESAGIDSRPNVTLTTMEEEHPTKRQATEIQGSVSRRVKIRNPAHNNNFH